MKREADSQLIKDGAEADDSVDPGFGLQKAGEEVLAGRKMKALPKRAMGVGQAKPLNGNTSEASSVPKFGGFSGFGAPSNGTSAFTFTPQNSTTPATASPFAIPSTAPSISTSASPATKTFASLITPTPEPLQPNLTNTSFPTAQVKEAAELEYYASLRGLNVSFISAITKAVEEDPFLDITGALDRYKEFRSGVQKTYRTKNASTSSSPKPSSTALPLAGMPAPPTSFSGFANLPKSSTPPTGEGFTPQVTSSTSAASPFSFPPAPTPETTNSTFTFGANTSSSHQKSNPFTFGATENKTPFTFGGGTSTADSSATSIFGGGTKPTSSTSALGLGRPSTQHLSSTAEDEKPGVSTSIFGGSSTSAFVSNPTPFGGFGKPGGSSVGFTFGGASTPAKIVGGSANGGGFTFGNSKPSGITFGIPPATETKPPVDGNGEADANSAATDADSVPPLPQALHDEEGEGEEDEDTMYAVKVKVYKMIKKGEEQQWADLGVGVCRVKRHKGNNSRRILLRNSSTGKIIINFAVYSGLKPTASKKVVSFIGHDSGESAMYKLRLKTDELAAELVEAIENEVSALEE